VVYASASRPVCIYGSAPKKLAFAILTAAFPLQRTHGKTLDTRACQLCAKTQGIRRRLHHYLPPPPHHTARTASRCHSAPGGDACLQNILPARASRCACAATRVSYANTFLRLPFSLTFRRRAAISRTVCASCSWAGLIPSRTSHTAAGTAGRAFHAFWLQDGV